jgi:1,2-diacylglycerol 3-beta-glucosyltransferase
MHLLGALLALAALPPLLASLYLGLLTLCSRRRVRPATSERPRFICVVPAHDEAKTIARTVESLHASRYPETLRRVWVVADNCTDETAARAREAGAEVLVRDEPDRRGKGYALELAFDRALAGGWADAVVVVDADTEVNPEFLEAFAAAISRGAPAAQAGSGVLNPNDSWRTQLMALALTLFNGVRSLGREQLGLSCGLRGNGMCLTTRALRAEPYRAFSLVEDLEYGVSLGRAGLRVRYVPEARVLSAMVSTQAAAASQRVRWEEGRAELATRSRWPLLAEALRRADLVLLDLALDLFVPPLTRLVLWLGAGTLASALLWALSQDALALAVWSAGDLLVAAYVLRGLWISGVGAQVLLAVPRFVKWKLSLGKQAAPREWVRTARE